MPLYAIIGRDGPQGLALRPTHREAHLARLEPLARAGRVVHAGPLLDEGGNPIGSLIVLEAEDLKAVQEIAARDPYVVHGVFASYDVRETRAVFSKS
jgi:uncharacterized protein YciI